MNMRCRYQHFTFLGLNLGISFLGSWEDNFWSYDFRHITLEGYATSSHAELSPLVFLGSSLIRHLQFSPVLSLHELFDPCNSP